MAQSSDEDVLLRNVVQLRRKLIRTEQNLQFLHSPSRERRLVDNLEYDELQEEDDHIPALTLDDLTPDRLTSSSTSLRSARSDYSRKSSRSSRHSASHQSRKSKFESDHNVSAQPSSSSLVGASTLDPDTEENRRLRKKLHAIREENSVLVAENHSLQNKIESSQFELRLTKSQLRMLGQEMEGSLSSVASLKKKCDSLKAELKVNGSALRMAEKSLDESGRKLSDKESIIHRHRQEMKKIHADLLEEQKLRDRMELQRNETVQRMEELSAELQNCRSTTQDQLQKLSASEEHLRGSLKHCDREREELLERATALEEDLQDARDEIRVLKETSTKLSGTETALLGSRQEAQENATRIQDLETTLLTRDRENKELSELNKRQSERLAECQRDIESSRDQLQKLEAAVARRAARENFQGGKITERYGVGDLISLHSSGPTRDSGFEPDRDLASSHSTTLSELRYQLAVKDVEIQQLRSSQYPDHQLSLASQQDRGSSSTGHSPTGLKAQLATLMEKSKLGEKRVLDLEKVIGRMESEAAKRTNENSRLRQKLAEIDSGRSSLESRLSLRDDQLSQLHIEIQEKSSHVINLEKELKKAKGKMSAMELQLEEKTTAFSVYVARIGQLQEQLDTASKELVATKGELARKTSSEEIQSNRLEELKKTNKEQCQELHNQLELMQQKMEHQSQEILTLQEERTKLQREASQKEEQLSKVRSDLAESQRGLVNKNVENQKLWNTLQSKADEGTLRLAQMEAALQVCKQELAMYITQLEDVNQKHQQERALKDREIADVEERWKKATVAMEERGIKIADLEQALQERQQMLQQSTERMAELEDREAQLEQQISNLAKDSSQQRSSAAQEAQLMEKKLHQACLDLEDTNHELAQHKQQLGLSQSELVQAKSTVADLEQKLKESRKDCESLTEKTSQLEKELHTSKVQFEEAQSTVKELEEVLERTKEEAKALKEKCRLLDEEFQQTQEDLRAAASQLGDLHRLLQRSKAENKLKQDRVEELNESLRKSQDEVRSKERDISEIDLALRTSQRELLQRSAQVTQLDVTVKERQSEMERQILDLVTELNKAQYQVKQGKQQVFDLQRELEKQSKDTHTKAVLIQDLETSLKRQTEDTTLKTSSLQQVERRVEELSTKLQESKKEYLEQSQELRLSREQTQQAHVNITELQRQLAQAQRNQDNLSSELEDALEMCRRKDLDLGRLAEEVGATRAQELALQAQYTSELQQIAKLRDAEVEQKEDEVSELQKSHAQLLISRDQLDSTHRLQIAQLKEAEQQASEALQEATKQAAGLQADLAAAKEVINASNEAMVIKESEIARLKAKLSGYERAMFGSQASLDSHSHHSSHHRISSLPSSPYTSPPIHPARRSLTSQPSPPFGQPSPPIGQLSPKIGHPPAPIGQTSLPMGHRSPPTDLYSYRGSSPGRMSYESVEAERPSHESKRFSEIDDVERLVVSDPPSRVGDALDRLLDQDLVRSQSNANTNATDMVTIAFRSGEEHRVNLEKWTERTVDTSNVKFSDKVDTFSEAASERSSVISGVERLPEHEQEGKDPGTFQAMLDFVNRQISAEAQQQVGNKDENWLNLEDFSDGSVLLSPSRSSRTSNELTGSLSPPTPLKGPTTSPSSRSAPLSPNSPRRRSGIPLRKTSSPTRRSLFSKVGNATGQTTGAGRKPKRKGQQSKSKLPDKSSSETTPLKQKLANQKAKLASHVKTQPISTKQLKPNECIADLQAKLKANDARRQEIDRELFGVL